MKRIKWKFSDYPVKTDTHFFRSRMTIGTHFKGVKSIGIEFHFENATVGFNKFYKKWVLGNNFESKVPKLGKLTSITIRLSKPIISLYFSKRLRDRALEALMRYKIKQSS